jgi:hypothetical protein
MKKSYLITFVFCLFLILSFIPLEAQDSSKTKDPEKKEQTDNHKQHFIDKDGDGYNDNAPDHDGDGIPNGLDPDWQKLQKERKRQRRFVDLDGDGINDNIQMKESTEEGKEQNVHGQNQGSSLEKKTKEQQQKQQKKQRGKP